MAATGPDKGGLVMIRKKIILLIIAAPFFVITMNYMLQTFIVNLFGYYEAGEGTRFTAGALTIIVSFALGFYLIVTAGEQEEEI